MGHETAEAEKLGTLSLVPGMPTEICLATAGQTALACMAKPVMIRFSAPCARNKHPSRPLSGARQGPRACDFRAPCQNRWGT